MGQATTVHIPDPGAAASYVVQTTAALSLAEADVLQGATEGAAVASKALVADSGLGLTGLATFTATAIDAGASGTAGSVDVFPATASRGKLAVTCTDQTGDTTVSLVADAMAAARTIHIPDPGATGYVVMSTAALALAEVDVLQDVTPGTNTASKAVVAGTDAKVGALTFDGAVGIDNDLTLTLGTTTATAETNISLEFDETTTGIGLFTMGSTSAPMVLNAGPGPTVIAHTVNINHSAGAGDCDDLIASYDKVNVVGDGDSGTTVVGHASRAYVGLTGGANNSVASQAYGSQPWARHQGTGAITAMSGVSAKLDVGADAFTASTVNAGHFHIDGAATVTGQFDGVMIEVYPDVTCMDSVLALMVDADATVTSGIRISGAMTNLLKLDVTTAIVTNALVPAEAPAVGTVGAVKAIVVDVGGTPYYIALYDTLKA
jgi:hypothetical protein